MDIQNQSLKAKSLKRGFKTSNNTNNIVHQLWLMDILRVEAVDKRLLEHNAWQQQPRSFDLCFLTHTGSCKNQSLGKDHSNSSSPTNMPLDVQRNHTLECPGTFCRMLRRETTWACPWGKASPSCDMEICGKPA